MRGSRRTPDDHFSHLPWRGPLFTLINDRQDNAAAERTGVEFVLPHHQKLNFAEACSGIRSLLSLTFLSLVPM